MRPIDQSYTTPFHLLMGGPMPLRADGIRDAAEADRIAEVRARISSGDLSVFDDPALFRHHPRLGDRVAAPQGWPSELGMVLRARDAGDLLAGRLFDGLASSPEARVASGRWIVWHCASGTIAHACDRDVVDVVWFASQLIELARAEGGYVLRRRSRHDFAGHDDHALAYVPRADLSADELVALTDRVVAVACDDHGQAACYDIIDVSVHPPVRLHTTAMLNDHPVISGEGRMLAYRGDGQAIVVVDLGATPARMSLHQLVVPAGTELLWGGLTVSWRDERLAVACADRDYRRFAWRGEFAPPLGERLALTRVTL